MIDVGSVITVRSALPTQPPAPMEPTTTRLVLRNVTSAQPATSAYTVIQQTPAPRGTTAQWGLGMTSDYAQLGIMETVKGYVKRMNALLVQVSCLFERNRFLAFKLHMQRINLKGFVPSAENV